MNGETLEHGARGLFRRVVQGVPHRASVPDPTEPGFGWWSVGLFVCSLVAWSALRTHQTALIAVSVLTLVSAALGFWAWQPTHRVSESQTRLVIGAGGWGLETTIIERVQLHQGPVTLPPSVALLERVPVTYSQDATTLTAKAWSSVAYWTPPRATSVPLRVIEGRIENRSQIRLEEVFVVGSGVQEPLEQGSDKRIASNGAYPPGELDLLASALPTGAVIARARASKTLYIALPEDL